MKMHYVLTVQWRRPDLAPGARAQVTIYGERTFESGCSEAQMLATLMGVNAEEAGPVDRDNPVILCYRLVPA